MVQLLNGSQAAIGNDQDSENLLLSQRALTPRDRLLKKWQDFLFSAPLPRNLAWAIIQLVSLLFWVAVAGAAYRFWH